MNTTYDGLIAIMGIGFMLVSAITHFILQRRDKR